LQLDDFPSLVLTFQPQEPLVSGHLRHPAVGAPQTPPGCGGEHTPFSNSEVTRMTTTETISSGLIEQQLLDCVRACADCAATCEACAKQCAQAGDASMATCIQLCLDCATTCLACIPLLARDSESYKELCRLCADLCDRCATECERYDDDKLRACAQACRHTAQMCRQMAS
jgi:hypothetical protein